MPHPGWILVAWLAWGAWRLCRHLRRVGTVPADPHPWITGCSPDTCPRCGRDHVATRREVWSVTLRGRAVRVTPADEFEACPLFLARVARGHAALVPSPGATPHSVALARLRDASMRRPALPPSGAPGRKTVRYDRLGRTRETTT